MKKLYKLLAILLLAIPMWATQGDIAAQTITKNMAYASFVAFTSATTSQIFDVALTNPLLHSIQVVVTGGPAGCTIKLETSLDRTNWTNASGDKTCTSSLSFYVQWAGATSVRINLSALSGGAAPTVTVVYLGTPGAGSSLVAQTDLTVQAASIGATTIYTVPTTADGVYEIAWVATVTRAATTSSTLGGSAAGLQIVYTDPDDSVVKTTPTAGASAAGTNIAFSQINQGNTTAVTANGKIVIRAKAGTNIQYQFGYTTSGATSMQYNLHIRVSAF